MHKGGLRDVIFLEQLEDKIWSSSIPEPTGGLPSAVGLGEPEELPLPLGQEQL